MCLVAKVLCPMEELFDMLDWCCVCESQKPKVTPTHRELMISILGYYLWCLQYSERMRQSTPCMECSALQ